MGTQGLLVDAYVSIVT